MRSGSSICCLRDNVTGTNLILTVRESCVERCLLDVAQDYASSLQ